MRFNRTFFVSFSTGRTGRVLLPVGFALVVAAGTWLVAESEGYERGRAGHASAQDSVKNLARLVAEPIELDDALLKKADRIAAPTMVRAIEPSALYRPSMSSHAKNKGEAGKPATVANVPAGVERFDRCTDGCDTRDPMIVRTSYPVVVGTPEDVAGPARPPAIVENRAQPADEKTFLGMRLPSLPSAGEMVDRTVESASATYDGLKASVTGMFSGLR